MKRARLTDMLQATRQRVERLRPRQAALEVAARAAPAPLPWISASRGEHVSVIAEVKRRSPSAGGIAPSLDPASHAAAYAAGGARAISVLTDGPHFGGSIDDLAAARSACALPILRKDFLLDPIQLYESRAAGASAVLLIVRALDPGQLRALAAVARELGLARLVEVHDAAELDAALAVDPESIGVNSRDLDTFEVDVEATASVLRAIPADTMAVAESGLASRADVERVAAWGADAILVGTVLARVSDPTDHVRALTGVRRTPRTGA